MEFKILKPSLQRAAFSKEDTLIFKGIGILLIAFHNFFHWISPYTGENEFNFQLARIHNFLQGTGNEPLESINLFFSYFGHYGVQIFFFFSGYGLMRAYGSKNIHYKTFIGNRLNKLYPAYIIAIVFFTVYNVLVFGKALNLVFFRDVLLQLTFLNNFVPGFIFRLNGPWWFYSVIVQLYLLFPLLVNINKKFPRYGFPVLFLTWFTLNAICYQPILDAGLNTYYTFAGHLPVFLLGMMLARREKIGLHTAVMLLSIVVFVLGNFFEIFWYFSQAAVVFILVYMISFWPKKISMRGSLRKLVVFYGSISMYLFAVHGFLRKPLVDKANGFDNAWVSLLLALLFMLIATAGALLAKKTEQYTQVLSSNINRWFKENGRKNYLRRAIKENYPCALRISLAFYFCLLAIRIYELLLYRSTHVFSAIRLEDFFMALSVDLALSMALSAVFIILYSLLPFRKAIMARILQLLILFLFIPVYMGTIQYYNTTLDMLDHVVYVYSISALTGIASSGAEVNLASVLPFIISPLVFLAFLYLLRKWKFNAGATILLVVLGFYFLADHNVYFPKQYQFRESPQYDFANNKLAYFGKMLFDHRPGKDDHRIRFDGEFEQKIDVLQGMQAGRDFLSKRYPYLYRIDSSNTLRPFFNDRIDSVKPNIVLMVVESLSASLSGENARYSSFTPFLDSLADKSLYWPNALSTSERTFGALPSILGSLPPANTGFAEMADSMPHHLNLVSLLKQNDYTTLFFYGGWAGFNNMEQYLNTGYIDHIETDFPGYEKMPTYSDGFTWGYGDKELYEYSLDYLDQHISEPYLSIYLTLSNHNPFMILNEAYYEKIAWEKVKEYGLQDDPKYTAKLKALKTHIYTDLTIKEFFRAYQERDDYKNTIFIITGDHITFAFPRYNRLETYHVPLIIYSPMLRQGHKSKRVVSHLDVTPSLQKLLGGNDSLSFPEQVHWLGQELDTVKNFGSYRTLAMMSGSREVSEFIHGDRFISGESLYTITDDLHLELIEDRSETESVSRVRADFYEINQYACNNAVIYPYNLYADWLKVVNIASYKDNFDGNTRDAGIMKHYSGDAYSGDRCLVCDTGMTYSHVFPETRIKNEVHKLNLRFEMKLRHYISSQLPILVVSLHNTDGKAIFWKSFTLPESVNSEKDKWHHFSASLPVRADQMITPGMVLKVFLWNQHKQASVLYDDVVVEVSGVL